MKYRFWDHIKRSVSAFFEDDCYSRASALSYYTILSIVPILAVAFGIAKGFGFERILEEEILQAFYQQQELAQKAIAFARSTLENAQGKWIAGVGVLALFWSALGLLGNFERALNAIWKIPSQRPLGRRITDYLPVLIFSPIFIVISSSLTFGIISKFVEFSVNQGVYQDVKPIIYSAYYILLLALTWLFFSFLYIYLPNRKVPWKSCLIAGVFAAFAFQSTQWGYIHLQIYLASYNAIYGSFAAVPLFMLWLQISWLITLAGAVIAAQESQIALQKEGTPKTLANFKDLLALALLTIHQGFRKKEPVKDAKDLSSRVNIDEKEAEVLLEVCQNENWIMQVMHQNEVKGFALAIDPEQLGLN